MAEGADNGRAEFPGFPYATPYPIQLDFMRALYAALEKGGVALFESPTGTGKTLSLIAACLHWLEDVNARGGEEAGKGLGGEEDNEDALPSWMIEEDALNRSEQAQQERLARQERQQRREMNEQAVLTLGRRHGGGSVKRKGVSGALSGGSNALLSPEALRELEELDEFELDAWEGDGMGKKRDAALESSDDEDTDGKLPEAPKKLQIIFCSRTHSQLSQFVRELHRTRFAESISLVSLASRQVLCVNPAVQRLKSPGLINERCAELGRGRIVPSEKKSRRAVGEASTPAPSSSMRCPYRARRGPAALRMQDLVLSQPLDVEDLARLGRKRDICPYYASRDAAPHADVVLLPYASLTRAETREALGLRLEGAVLVVDEAHNLAEAVGSAHAAGVNLAQARSATAQLSAYWEAYRRRLAPSTGTRLQQLVRAAQALERGLEKGSGDSVFASLAKFSSPAASPSAPLARPSTLVLTVTDCLIWLGLEHLNLLALSAFARQTHLAAKVSALWTRRRGGGASVDQLEGGASLDSSAPQAASLHAFLALLTALSSADEDGRAIVDSSVGLLRFMLLDPGRRFSEVARQARAVVLASGTLAPLGPVLRLFPGVPEADMARFSCGHVVGPDRLRVLTIGKDPAGRALDFRHSSRSTPQTLDSLGCTLQALFGVVPGGTVVFLQSFELLAAVESRWRATGVLDALLKLGPVFVEPRRAEELEALLLRYQAACCGEQAAGSETASRADTTGQATRTPNKPKALMLCVVGGKLSEGINFADAMGRCAAIAGLPYPNLGDLELVEKLRRVAEEDVGCDAASRVESPLRVSAAAREAYGDLCFKSVNQCVGRVIRHARDHASILFLDQRYVRDAEAQLKHNHAAGPLGKLSAWVRDALQQPGSCADALSELEQFYARWQAA